MSIQEHIECGICFQEVVANDVFVCGVGQCTTVNCLECTVAYYNYSEQDRAIPTCPGCRRTITYGDVREKEYVDVYLKCLSKYLIGLYSGKEEIKEKIEVAALYEKIRNDRMLFMQKKFPVAVQLVVKLSMQDKYNKLNKTMAEIKVKDQKGARIPCMKISCKGALDERYQCRLCETFFCKDCERVRLDEHKCNEDDLASLRELRSIVKCPECSTPIFKHSGCNHMTCAVCKANFTYSDGEKSDYGSRNDSVEVKKEYSLSKEYKKELQKIEALEFVYDLESVPVPVLSSAFGKAIMKLVQGEDDRSNLIFLAKEHEKYSCTEKKYRGSRRGLNEIEDAIREGSITLELVQKVHKDVLL